MSFALLINVSVYFLINRAQIAKHYRLSQEPRRLSCTRSVTVYSPNREHLSIRYSKKQKTKQKSKVEVKMTIFESFECCKWFLIATTSVILVVLTHNLLFLPPYPPIFGLYPQKSFAFYVKKYVMRILLKYQKRAPIKDDEADKLQPLSSDPLVSTFFYMLYSERYTWSHGHCRHSTRFISTRALQMAKSSYSQWLDERRD